MSRRPANIHLGVQHQPPRDNESLPMGTHLVLHSCGHLWPHTLNAWKSTAGSALDPLNILQCPACRGSTCCDVPIPFLGADSTEDSILDASVKHLLSWSDIEEARRQNVTYGNPGNCCDCCSRSLGKMRLFVDGVHRETGLWAFMCPACFLRLGRGLGDGLGQLFMLIDDRSWLQVAGFAAGDPTLAMGDLRFLFEV